MGVHIKKRGTLESLGSFRLLRLVALSLITYQNVFSDAYLRHIGHKEISSLENKSIMRGKEKNSKNTNTWESPVKTHNQFPCWEINSQQVPNTALKFPIRALVHHPQMSGKPRINKYREYQTTYRIK